MYFVVLEEGRGGARKSAFFRYSSSSAGSFPAAGLETFNVGIAKAAPYFVSPRIIGEAGPVGPPAE